MLLKLFQKTAPVPSQPPHSHVQRQGQQPRGATPCLRKGAAAALCWSSHEEIPHVQGKRNPSKMVGAERGHHQRAERLKPQSQTTSQSDRTDEALSNSMKLSHAMWGHTKRTGHGGEVWQNVVHRRREQQTTSIFLPWEPHEQYEKGKRTRKDELPRSVAQYTTGDQWRNNSRKNERKEPKQKQHSLVDGTSDRSKFRCCKEQYCIGTWNVRSMNQGKLEVVKQEMARVNIDILGISELRWTGMSELNSFQSILVRWFLECRCSLLPSPVWPLPICLDSWT